MSTKCPRNNEYTHSHQNGSICAKQGGQGRGGFEPVSGTDIKPNEWADRVFAPDYKLRQLGEVAAYIADNQYLTGGYPLGSGNGAGGHGCDRTERQTSGESRGVDPVSDCPAKRIGNPAPASETVDSH